MLLIRARGQRAIVRQVPAESLNPDHVEDQVRRLAADFPPTKFEVDISQVSYARPAIGI
jgi:hypothetical protein